MGSRGVRKGSYFRQRIPQGAPLNKKIQTPLATLDRWVASLLVLLGCLERGALAQDLTRPAEAQRIFMPKAHFWTKVVFCLSGTSPRINFASEHPRTQRKTF